MKLIIPKKLIADPAKLSRALTNTMNGVQKDIKIDFAVTTQTWKEQVDFMVSSPSTWTRRVSTDNTIYAFVNDGTRAHEIRPKGRLLRFTTPFTAKTVPNQILSRSGGSGSTPAVARAVHHPGTKPRAFDKAIKDKWDRQFGTIMQRALDSEVS